MTITTDILDVEFRCAAVLRDVCNLLCPLQCIKCGKSLVDRIWQDIDTDFSIDEKSLAETIAVEVSTVIERDGKIDARSCGGDDTPLFNRKLVVVLNPLRVDDALGVGEDSEQKFTVPCRLAADA